MKHALIAAGLAACIWLTAARVEAQSLTVQYMEGNAAQRTTGAWTSLSIGDQLSLDASVKLERLALVQLKSPGSSIASITLTQPGTYALRTVVAAGASLRSAGAVQAAAIAFSRVLKGTGKRVDAVGGVRSEMPREDIQGLLDDKASSAVDPGPETPEVTPARRAIDLARDLIASAGYDRAISVLWDAIPAASADEAREAHFYLACAQELAGDGRSALAALAAAAPKSGDPWAADSVLLGARLLEDSFAWAQARDLLLEAGTSLQWDEQRAPTYLFLLALAYHGTAEKEQRDLVAEKLISLDPESDLGVAAARLREMP
jgi:hypothetical protein